jgi:predicted DNA-binding transcriptional regulator YafY
MTTTRKPTRRREPQRGRLLQTAIRACVILRRGRWTMFELADELGVEWRTAYRIIHDMRATGVTVDASEERNGRERAVYYSVPAGALRRLLRL